MELTREEIELAAVEERFESEVENPRMSIDGFLALMRERDRLREVVAQAKRAARRTP